MNNLSNEYLEVIRKKAAKSADYVYRLKARELESIVSELLALREAEKKPVAATMFKPVADLFLFKAPGCRWWSITEDAESISEMVRSGWPVREYVTLERFQQSYAAPQLPAVPEGWVMVPVEPTVEMREAFHIADDEANSGMHFVYSPDHQWHAMIAAAPKPEVK
ncbi:hypothetical protein RJE46_14320 [Cedecea neteri]|uniref:hypothetical protein n=1 Tax=Cedecea neteri TaxID=158822 RepID=UPI0028932045|nr:hypothetical protein [Cedecea neteri]WNJ77808.1 hypothetical protein RJE46_14320 [Cedecea neteri]